MLLNTNFISIPNSAKNCLHIPQGYVKSFDEDTIAIFVNSLYPSDTAFMAAHRSAHIVAPYQTFSILHPVNMCPVFVAIAAPTLKFE